MTESKQRLADAWMVRWTLLGQPSTLSWDMLVTIPGYVVSQRPFVSRNGAVAVQRAWISSRAFGYMVSLHGSRVNTARRRIKTPTGVTAETSGLFAIGPDVASGTLYWQAPKFKLLRPVLEQLRTWLDDE